MLSALRYDQNNWEVIGNFKMVALLMGLQQGFTKFPCYLCLWDSRNTNFHYNKRNWPPRSSYDIQTIKAYTVGGTTKSASATSPHQTGPHQAVCKEVEPRK